MYTAVRKSAKEAQSRRTAKVPRWNTSNTENRYLSFYGLKVTFFQNKKHSGSTICVSQNGGTPAFSNFAAEAEARAAAEQTFLQLKRTGVFKAPPSAPAPSFRELMENVIEDGRVPPGFEAEFTELIAVREREGERADLFQLLDGGFFSDRYWVPHSQGVILSGQDGYCHLVVSTWWFNRAEPVQ